MTPIEIPRRRYGFNTAKCLQMLLTAMDCRTRIRMIREIPTLRK